MLKLDMVAMRARFLADLVMLAHFSFVAFAVLGRLLPWQPWTAWLHLPVVAWSVAINLLGRTCPLTPLEQRWRKAAGQDGYRGGFVAHYLGPLIYPAGMPRRLELVVVIALPLWTALVYVLTTIYFRT